MKIKIVKDVPVNREHGIEKGKIYHTVRPPKGYEDSTRGVWVTGKTGAPVRLWSYEFEPVEDDDGN